jgi:effector-binding domain-containing protein
MRIQTVPAMSYLYLPLETTFAEMGKPVRAGFDRVYGAAYEAKLFIARPSMMVYDNNPHLDPRRKFKLEIGVIVSADAKIEAADLKIRKTAPFKCATILYTGTVLEQGQAYKKLFPAIQAANLELTGEEREMCLYWAGMESSNNVYMMMVGVK